MFASVNSPITKFFLDSKDLVVLCKSIRSTRSTTLDLAGTKSDDEVSDEGVFCLSTSMRNHDAPTCLLGHVARFNALSDGTDLVYFEEHGIAEVLIDSSLDSGWVGDEKVITDYLKLFS
jgi:hypothetical protein